MGGLLDYNAHRPVVVAVIPMRMMQVAFDEVIEVIAVRHGLVPAARAVDML